MNQSLWCAALGVGALLVVGAGCGGADDSGTLPAGASPSASTAPVTTSERATTAPPTTTAPTSRATTEVPAATAAPATSGSTALPRPELPETPVVAVLEQPYAFDGSMPDMTLLPAQPGEAVAHWYRAGPVYAVVYDGLSPDAPACPGNSAQTTAGFDFVSNAAVAGMSCDVLWPFVESNASQGVQVCGGLVSYLTLIPSDLAAVLYASIELPVDEVGGVGIGSAVPVADPTVVPEIDPAVLAC